MKIILRKNPIIMTKNNIFDDFRFSERAYSKLNEKDYIFHKIFEIEYLRMRFQI